MRARGLTSEVGTSSATKVLAAPSVFLLIISIVPQEFVPIKQAATRLQKRMMPLKEMLRNVA
jgi:hypothetical protein